MALRPVLVGAVAATVAFVVLMAGVAWHWSPAVRWDQAVVSAGHGLMLSHPALRTVTRLVTDVGSPASVDVITGGAALGLLVAGRRRAAVYLVVIRVLELALETGIKHLVGRPRPALPDPIAHASGLSFPSGHAAGTAVLITGALLVSLPAGRRTLTATAVVAAAVAVLAVAASRVLLGVHYPSDVLAGMLLGLACASSCVPALTARTPPPRP